MAGGPTDSAYAQLKGQTMIAEEFAPSFALDSTIKGEAELIGAAMDSVGLDDSLMTALHGLFARPRTATPRGTWPPSCTPFGGSPGIKSQVSPARRARCGGNNWRRTTHR